MERRLGGETDFWRTPDIAPGALEGSVTLETLTNISPLHIYMDAHVRACMGAGLCVFY